jgi:hypothetical protein
VRDLANLLIQVREVLVHRLQPWPGGRRFICGSLEHISMVKDIREVYEHTESIGAIFSPKGRVVAAEAHRIGGLKKVPKVEARTSTPRSPSANRQGRMSNSKLRQEGVNTTAERISAPASRRARRPTHQLPPHPHRSNGRRIIQDGSAHPAHHAPHERSSPQREGTALGPAMVICPSARWFGCLSRVQYLF